MRLTLMRHGAAAVHGPWADADRPLTPEGEEQARQSARGLACMQQDLDAILCSPAQRCHDTARIVAEEIGLGVRVVQPFEALALGNHPGPLLERLRQEESTSVLWVGHQPVLEQLASHLLLGEGVLPFQLLPAACVGLHCRVRRGEVRTSLLWVLRSPELGMLRCNDKT